MSVQELLRCEPGGIFAWSKQAMAREHLRLHRLGGPKNQVNRHRAVVLWRAVSREATSRCEHLGSVSLWLAVAGLTATW